MWKTCLEDCKNRKKKSQICWCVFDLANKERQLAKLEKQAENPQLWEDPQAARETMRKLSRLREEVTTWKGISGRIADGLELIGLGDHSLRDELEAEVETIQTEVARLDLQTLFSGEYDDHNAILAIHAGAGGTDAQDWTAMLQRMYLRWIEAHKFKAEVLDQTEGETAGIKSVMVAVSGPDAYGHLKAEKGVHRLVRHSPFDSSSRRHTSFALVEVYPEVEDTDEVEIKPDDIQIDTYKSAGAGGQNVQKNETAIRITHKPTGLVVTCQNERSQTQNKETAFKVLRSRLLDLKRRERAEEIARLKGEHVKAEFGSQIRSYVLQPYQLVKDHRTSYETGNTQAVLDGDLDGFIEAYLRSRVGDEPGR